MITLTILAFFRSGWAFRIILLNTASRSNAPSAAAVVPFPSRASLALSGLSRLKNVKEAVRGRVRVRICKINKYRFKTNAGLKRVVLLQKVGLTKDTITGDHS